MRLEVGWSERTELAGDSIAVYGRYGTGGDFKKLRGIMAKLAKIESCWRK